MRGRLESDPLLKGVVAGAVLESLSGGKSASGRHMRLSQEQRDDMALAVANLKQKPHKALLRRIGLNAAKPVLRAGHDVGLTKPYMATEGEPLQDNITKVARILRQDADEDLEPLVVICDETKTLAKYDAGMHDGTMIVTGGRYPDKAIQAYSEDLDLDLEVCATQVLDFVAKRPDCDDVVPLSSVPCGPKTCNQESMQHFFIAMVAQFMACSEARLLSFGFDGHQSFLLICKFLLGLCHIPDGGFWVNFACLGPLVDRWPFGAMVCKHLRNGLYYVIYGCTDILHLQKSLVWAMRSSCRTIRLGWLRCDWSVFLSLGLSLNHFRGKDRQSDREAAVFMALCFLGMKGRLTPIMYGPLLMILMTLLVGAAWMSKSLTLMHRHLAAGIAFYYMRMCRNYLAKLAKAEGCSCSTRFALRIR